MKHTLFLLILAFISQAIIAQQFTSNGLNFGLISDTSVTVMKYHDYAYYSGDVVIPEKVTYDGKQYTVTEISSSSFEDCAEMTSIHIPQTVVSFGDRVFYNCKSLTDLVLPDNTHYLGNNAISYCDQLKTISFPDNIKVLNWALFEGCMQLERVNLPANLQVIQDFVFTHCPMLDSVIIPAGVKVIAQLAFSNCKRLSYVKMNDSIKTLGPGAFENCVALKELVLPKKMTNIEDGAFTNCTSLSRIVLPDSIITFKGPFINCYALTTVELPRTIKSITVATFAGCSNLKHIRIPNGVTKIEERAFDGCMGLETLILPKTLTTIEGDAFGSNARFTNLVLCSPTPPQVQVSLPSYNNPRVIVPESALEAYKSDPSWSVFSYNEAQVIEKTCGSVVEMNPGFDTIMYDYVSSYQWFKNDEAMEDTTASLQVQPNASSIYTLRGYDANKEELCSQQYNAVIEPVFFHYPDTIHVRRMDTLTIAHRQTNAETLALYTFEWRNKEGQLVSTEAQPTWLVTSDTTLFLHVSSLVGCQFDDTVFLHAITPPKAPDVNIQASYNAITLSWNQVEDSTVVGFRVYRRAHDGDYVLVATLGKDDTTYVEYHDEAIRYDYIVRSFELYSVLSEPSKMVSGAATRTLHVDANVANSGSGAPESPFKTIYEAINMAMHGDSILIHPGVYMENLKPTKRLHLVGVEGPFKTIVQSAQFGYSVIDLTHAQATMTTLKGLTIKEGGPVRGSAINVGGLVRVDNCVIQDNEGEGAIHTYGSQVVFSNCLFTDNSMHLFKDPSSEMLFINCTFDDSYLSYGFFGGDYPMVFINCQLETPILADHRIFHSNGMDMQQADIQHNMEYRPLYADGFDVSVYSPLIGKGTRQLKLDLKTGLERGFVLNDTMTVVAPSTDILGRPRVGERPDVGAFEQPLDEPLPFPAIDSLVVNDREFRLDFSWTYPAFDGLIAYFELWKQDRDGMVLYDTTSLLQYTDSIVKPGMTYAYQFRAISNDQRVNAFSDTFRITVNNLKPQPVSLVAARLVDFNTVDVQWKKPVEPDFYRYTIKRINPLGDTILLSDRSTNGFRDTLQGIDLAYYTYSAVAQDSGGMDSEAVSFVVRSGDNTAPDTVRNLTCYAEPDRIWLRWDANAEADVSTYRIHRKTDVSVFELIGETQQDVLLFKDSTVTNEVLYTYAVSAVDSLGDSIAYDPAHEGAWSHTVSIKAPDVEAPGKPQGLVAKRTHFRTVALSWEPNSEPDLRGYAIYRMGVTEDSIFKLTDTLKTTSFVDADSSLGFQTYYRYFLSALDTIGNESERAFLDVKTGDVTVPEQVMGLSAIGYPDSISLAWDKSKAPDLHSYRIYRGTSIHALAPLKDVLAPCSTFVDKEVENAVSYYYAVTARDSLGIDDWDPAYESERSTIVTAHALDIVAPQRPMNLSSQSYNRRIKLKWQANGEGDVAHYAIHRSLDSLDYIVVDSVDKDVSMFEDVKVENGPSYYYYVTAVDTNRNVSEPSDVIVGRPYNQPPLIQQLKDTVIHNVIDNQLIIPFTVAESVDNDGSLVSYEWFVDGMRLSDQSQPQFVLPHGSTQIKAIVTDNDGARDSAACTVTIDAAYYRYDHVSGQHVGLTVLNKDYIYNAEDGGRMQVLDWAFSKVFDVSINGDINSVSSVSSDTIMYLSSNAKTLFCFDRKGVSKWSLPLGGDLKATPTIDMSRNRVYVGVSNNNIFGIDRKTGRVIWSYRTDSPISQPAVIVGRDLLILLTQSGKALLFDLTKAIIDESLVPSATLNLNATILTAPAIDKDGFLYVSTVDGQLIKFVLAESDLSSAVVWRASSARSFTTSPVIGYDGTVYIGSTDGLLHAFEGESGLERWSLDVNSPISTTITINDEGFLYVGTEEGVLYAVSDDGSILWRFEAGSAIAHATAYLDGCILFANQKGELFRVTDPIVNRVFPAVVEPANGSKMPNGRMSTLFKPGQTAAVAFRMNENQTVTKKPQWGTYQGNSRRTGSQVESYVTPIAVLNADNTMDIMVYPNPVQEKLRVAFHVSEVSRMELRITDLNGRLIHVSESKVYNQGSHEFEVNANEWSSGIYLLQVMVNETLFTQKIVKQY